MSGDTQPAPARVSWTAMDVVHASGALNAQHKQLLDLFAQVEQFLRDAGVKVKVTVCLSSGDDFGWTRNPFTEQWGFSVTRETKHGPKSMDIARATRPERVEAGRAIGALIDALVAEIVDQSDRMRDSTLAVKVALEWLNARSEGSSDV